MEHTGIIRRIDDLGRFQIPKEIRKRLKLNAGDAIEVILIGDSVCLTKYNILQSLIKDIDNNLSAITDEIRSRIGLSDETEQLIKNIRGLLQQLPEEEL